MKQKKRFSDPTELHESFKTVFSAGVVEWEVRGIHTMGWCELLTPVETRHGRLAQPPKAEARATGDSNKESSEV